MPVTPCTWEAEAGGFEFRVAYAVERVSGQFQPCSEIFSLTKKEEKEGFWYPGLVPAIRGCPAEIPECAI